MPFPTIAEVRDAAVAWFQEPGRPRLPVLRARLAALITPPESARSSVMVGVVPVSAWQPSTDYTVGFGRTNAGRVYRCITAGTSAAAGGPTTTSQDITDGTAHWRYLGEAGTPGIGFVLVVTLIRWNASGDPLAPIVREWLPDLTDRPNFDLLDCRDEDKRSLRQLQAG